MSLDTDDIEFMDPVWTNSEQETRRACMLPFVSADNYYEMYLLFESARQIEVMVDEFMSFLR
jgi:hypothetical protein